MGNIWETVGKQMGNRWETDRKQMGNRWETDGKQMGNRWETDGKHGSNQAHSLQGTGLKQHDITESATAKKTKLLK
jgi:hypothetical protein